MKRSMMSSTLATAAGQQPTDLLSQYLGNLGFPAFIISTFFPSLFGKLSKYPRAARMLTVPLVLWLASTFLVRRLMTAWRSIMSNAMSSVTISSDDFYLYAAFKSWLSKQKMMMLEKAINAQSVFYLRNKGQDGRTIEKELANNKSIVFDPQNKFQLFRHQGRFFLLTMDTKHTMHTPVDRTEMKIWTLGLSPKPIENLLLEVYDSSRSSDSRTLTTIMTPYGGRQWNRRCIKPARPLSSVYLEPDEKDRLVADVKDYLAPTTAKWYQDRGIPYRRGYLFHGSPGTGKTSLAVALAGHFKLDVYIVSLLDLELSDSALLQLFQAVRSGVLVLLEDVDSAGLGREVEETSVPDPRSTVANANGMLAERKKAKAQSSRITLSGLLNAIDGAGAPEGHVLVMTTNTPDALDEALVRPGRIDVKVEFRKASKGQVKDIFVNMYRPVPSFDEKDEKSEVKRTADEKEEEQVTLDKEAEKHEQEKQQAALEEMADRFAASVPQGVFSPAELQDYILLRKDQPQRAVDEIDEWVTKGLMSASSSTTTQQAANVEEGAAPTTNPKKTKRKSKKTAPIDQQAPKVEENPQNEPTKEITSEETSKTNENTSSEDTKVDDTKFDDTKVNIPHAHPETDGTVENTAATPSEPRSPSPSSDQGSEETPSETTSDQSDTSESSVEEVSDDTVESADIPAHDSKTTVESTTV